MRRMKQKAKNLLGYLYWPFPQRLRRGLIQLLLWPELHREPRQSVRWLLGIHDYVEVLINHQCGRWGNGVHIKHQLMTGIHSFFYDRIPSGARVLDVGCGYGAVAYALVTHTQAQVVGIDFDSNQIAAAQRRFQHPNLRFEVGDATQDLPDGQFDVVVMSSVLEHIQPRVELLCTLLQRFNPKLFLIRVPTFERHHFAAIKRELGLFPYTDATHVLEYSPEVFQAEMERAGLDIRYMEIRWGDIWAECVPRPR